MKRTTSYQEIAEKIRRRIRSKEWQPGQMLPGRRALAKEYNVACATMERVISVLIAEKTLFSEDRRGTFVSEESVPQRNRALILPDQAGGTFQATIGIVAGIVPYESASLRESQWPAQILSALENRLSMEAGVTQHFFNFVEGIGKEDIDTRVAVDQLIADGVDAIVLIGISSSDTIAYLLEALSIPVVLVDYDPAELPIHQVFMDSVSGGYQAYNHLKQRGYQDIAYLRPFNSIWVENRLRGAKMASSGQVKVIPAYTENGLPASGREQQALGYDLGAGIIATGFRDGTGIIAPNDAIAKGFMAAASEKSLEPGKDFGIIGFDNYNRDLNLSSLCPPLAQLGNEAAINICRILRGESVPSRSALKPQLIARKSSSNYRIDG